MKTNQIYNKDCIEGMKNIEDNTVDLIVTSPPYNIDIDYDGYNDYMPWDEYIDWTTEWLKECYRVLKSDGRICINHYISYRDKDKVNRFPIMDIRNIQEELEYNTRRLALWKDRTKSKLTAWGSWKSASSPYIQQPYEGILISYKDQWKKKNKEGENTIDKTDFIEGTSGIWDVGTDNNNDFPASFPVELPKLCIELLSYKNDLVLDPFIGSGTTAIAAIQTARNYIGFDISEKSCQKARERINNVQLTFNNLF